MWQKKRLFNMKREITYIICKVGNVDKLDKIVSSCIVLEWLQIAIFLFVLKNFKSKER